MAGKRPLYLQVKPHEEARLAIDPLRPAHGIDTVYGRERYHVTVQPLGDVRLFTSAMLDQIDAALDALCLEPFEVRFDRIDGNALHGGGMREFRRRREAIVRCLSGLGLALPDYRFHPHLSLAYGERQHRRIAIPPIGWIARELLLVASIHGEGRHELVARWPLVPRQGVFGF